MYKFCLIRQVNEIELLKSIYCDDGEFGVLNEEQYELFKAITESSKSLPPMDIDDLPSFILNFKIPIFDERKGNKDVTMNITMPPFYPSSESVDVVFHGANKIIPREQEKVLRQEIDVFLQAKVGQECVLDLVQFVRDWISDNIGNSYSSSPPPDSSCSSSPPQSKTSDFKRVLIWFSTIAPDRAKVVAEWAKQLALTGLSKFGTPALAVVEGAAEDVDQFVSSLRTFRWKRLDVLFEDCSKVADINSARKFSSFEDSMTPLLELQPLFRSAGLEDMYKEGLKIHAPNLKIF